MRIQLSIAIATLCLLPSLLFAGEYTSTHKQIRTLTPQHNGKAIHLNTFCLDLEGNILACVGGESSAFVIENGQPVESKTKATNLLQRYTAQGELLSETELDFKPTAINQAQDGLIYVAGVGQVAKLSAEGEVLLSIDSPHLGDKEEMRKQAVEAAEKQMKMMTESFTRQVERVNERLAALKEKDEDSLSARDKRMLKSLHQQSEMYTQQLEQIKESFGSQFSPDAMLANATGITSLAVTKQDVFLCCRAAGRGYNVWRTNRDLEEPKQVVSDLGGCCGQCDIQANDDYLVLAENTRFRVGLLDRDGKRIRSFGKQDRSSNDGFGSCCNPMNVRCCDNGDILTAESSIGNIKRFNAEGELVAVIGKAKIGGGCKHVAIGFDAKLDRYYMQYQDKSQICVLVPLSEAPEFTADELAAKEAAEGLAKQLVAGTEGRTGQWTLTGKAPKSAQRSSGIIGAIATALGGGSDEEDVVVSSGQQSATSMTFTAGGKLTLVGGLFGGGENEWAAIRQDEKTQTLVIAQLQDGVQYYDYEIVFVNENEAKISMMYSGSKMSSNTYYRVIVNVEDTEETEDADAAAAADESATDAG